MTRRELLVEHSYFIENARFVPDPDELLHLRVIRPEQQERLKQYLANDEELHYLLLDKEGANQSYINGTSAYVDPARNDDDERVFPYRVKDENILFYVAAKEARLYGLPPLENNSLIFQGEPREPNKKWGRPPRVAIIRRLLQYKDGELVQGKLLTMVLLDGDVSSRSETHLMWTDLLDKLERTKAFILRREEQNRS